MLTKQDVYIVHVGMVGGVGRQVKQKCYYACKI